MGDDQARVATTFLAVAAALRAPDALDRANAVRALGILGQAVPPNRERGNDRIQTTLLAFLRHWCEISSASSGQSHRPRKPVPADVAAAAAELRCWPADPQGLTELDLSNLDLSYTDLRYTELRNASLERSLLVGARLDKAQMRGTQMRNADLHEASLLGANLIEADLFSANLSGTNLSKAYLSDARLRETNLERANLTGAVLAGADLEYANLERADLTGVDLTDVRLGGAQLSKTQGLPDGYDPGEPQRKRITYHQ
ncbi:pentapeptide repeat-containing protein [Amycolatopsis japonica]|uniref:pentapeptide repeat-containing protein n=1 Tax=Amycolatopsis japonica TaxID=208439 RepID=UPI00366DB7E9